MVAAARAAAFQVLMQVVAETAAVPLVAAALQVVVRPIRVAAHPEAGLRTKAYSKAPAVAAVAPRARLAQLAARWAAAVPRAQWVAEQPVAVVPRVVAPQVVPTRMPAACKAAAVAEPRAVEQLVAVVPKVAARLAAAECRAAVVPLAVQAPWAAVPQVVLVVFHRPEAELPVAEPTVLRVARRAAVLQVAAVA